MSTTLRSTATSGLSHRIPLLASASTLIAVVSVTITMMVTAGGDGSASVPRATPETAAPDRATLYQRGVEAPQPSAPIDGRRAAELFHHFR